ncbi:DUF2478 domain-containing protein [Maritimibacter sp. HL-12]|uniref:DUF2478 domain-containing protein n=1 Tax=Maritimibacter sp. HL-12 TaxID=1162418 RepID=UPI000A0EEB38|nr:DUF2478 domain-containing protein [Maritimibacter sp. HL-12]SMH50480.1 Protein of unknown function [Maritimibacter sp. HL-12]
MQIASTTATGDTDQVLFSLAQDLMGRGLKVCGTVQINTEREKTDPCDMDLRVLPGGPDIRISQDLGGGAQGCRLDVGALEAAVGHVSAALEAGADVLIINKFGKHEAEGRGFRSVIAEALARDVPVLVGLNGLNRDAFEAFTEGCGDHLPADVAVLSEWLFARSGSVAAAM